MASTSGSSSSTSRTRTVGSFAGRDAITRRRFANDPTFLTSDETSPSLPHYGRLSRGVAESAGLKLKGTLRQLSELLGSQLVPANHHE